MVAVWAVLALPAAARAQGVAIPNGPGPFPVSDALPPESRQFDFWVGEWDVNLRVRQPDGSWVDEVASEARIYPILNGKAILELWSDARLTGIKGYSLRYFDPAQDAWILWLNWPSGNQSGSSALRGSFRHGRGEFFAGGNGGPISRYTFSDITENSLRWDDAVSGDNGATWSANWIMEFSRSGAKPVLSPEGGPAHTFHDGTRCDAPEFRRYEFLAGSRRGQVEAGGSGGVAITGHRILDGCAVMTFAGAEGDPETLPERAWGFSHITWNSRREAWELTALTSGADRPAQIFYSEPDAPASGPLLLYLDIPGGAPEPTPPRDRMRIEQTTDGAVLWVHETPDGNGGWTPVWQGRVR